MAKTPNITTAPTGQIAPFGLRMLPELREKIEEAAKAAGRSMNAEIISRLESSFRSLDAENAASILMENNHLRERLEARDRAESVNDWVITTLAKYLVDAIQALPDSTRQERFAGVLPLANGIVNKDGGQLFKFFASTAMQVGDAELAEQLEAHKEDFEAIEDAKINALKIPVTVRGKKTEIVIGGDLREAGVAPIAEPGLSKPKTKWFDRGYIYSVLDVTTLNNGVRFIARLTITDNATKPGDAALISDEIELLHKFHGHDSTVWLELQGDKVPRSVREAINRLAGFGVGLVVTLNGRSTLSKPEAFDQKLIADLQKAYRHGEAWCPIEKRMMDLER